MVCLQDKWEEQSTQGDSAGKKQTACQTDLGDFTEEGKRSEREASSLPRSGEVFFVRVRLNSSATVVNSLNTFLTTS